MHGERPGRGRPSEKEGCQKGCQELRQLNVHSLTVRNSRSLISVRRRSSSSRMTACSSGVGSGGRGAGLPFGNMTTFMRRTIPLQTVWSILAKWKRSSLWWGWSIQSVHRESIDLRINGDANASRPSTVDKMAEEVYLSRNVNA